MLVDCLCHLDDPRIADVQSLLQRAVAGGVAHLVWAGTDPLRDHARVLACPPGLSLWHAFGIHPACVRADELEAQLDELDRLLRGPRVMALGECGLDRRPGMPPLDLQMRALRAQIDLARTHKLPLLLHAVRATGALLEVLRLDGPLPRGGMVHGYSGSAESARELVRLGLHISFGSLVTRPNASRAREALRAVPLPRLLVETDTPGHPPHGATPGIAEPGHLPLLLRAMAEIREDPWEALAATCARNARQLLGLPGPC